MQSEPTVHEDSLASFADYARTQLSRQLEDTRARLGQFLTPRSIAHLMAGFFGPARGVVRILDPGAGVGTLTAALVDRLLAQPEHPDEIHVTCYEIDARLFAPLEQILTACREHCRKQHVPFSFDLRREDYVEARASASRPLFGHHSEIFDRVILNPPYRKIGADSRARHQLRSVGVETGNLYSAFMLLSARQLCAGGEFVSISPRSFCNGPYFRCFRHDFLRLLDIRHLHLFESRAQAFRDDSVLQENLIVHAVRSDARRASASVSITDLKGRITTCDVPARQVVNPDDSDSVIHVVTHPRGFSVAESMRFLPETLDSLKLKVSTGRVVDFRARQYLRLRPTANTVPLVYPAHVRAGAVVWPNGNTRKPNAIIAADSTADLLVPRGFYVLTKRFSAKEEPRRVVAALFDDRQTSADRIGFDNKLNYFHRDGGGLDELLARGLTAFLNSSIVDEYFRLFSGHTQVNAADLRRLRYPRADQLQALGADLNELRDCREVDQRVARLFHR